MERAKIEKVTYKVCFWPTEIVINSLYKITGCKNHATACPDLTFMTLFLKTHQFKKINKSSK